MDFEEYKAIICQDIRNCLDDMACQPIIFVGSGLSRRYINAPKWEELLKILAESNPKCSPYAFYKQKMKCPVEIGSALTEAYTDWAWSDGKDSFDSHLFDESYSADIFIKSKIVDLLKELLPESILDFPTEFQHEIEALQEIRPHAIITTNYDKMLELIFPEYEPIIGQKILKSQYTSIGEIFKIHGCTSSAESLVFNKTDYDEFISKKKYLSAKLLTYFLEHPILFIGYSITDENVRAILSDIDEILTTNNELVPNIYMINYCDSDTSNLYYETLIRLEGERSIRIKNITTSEFEWVFKAFINENVMENINPKLLRALLSRTYNLVRTDVPKRNVEIDYETLSHALQNDGDISKIFGITTLSNPSAFNASYPFTLTEVALELGYRSWYHANVLIEKIYRETKIDIKSSDNNYHISVVTGRRTNTRKYSYECIDLLKKIKNNEPYELDL